MLALFSLSGLVVWSAGVLERLVQGNSHDVRHCGILKIPIHHLSHEISNSTTSLFKSIAPLEQKYDHKDSINTTMSSNMMDTEPGGESDQY